MRMHRHMLVLVLPSSADTQHSKSLSITQANYEIFIASKARTCTMNLLAHEQPLVDYGNKQWKAKCKVKMVLVG